MIQQPAAALALLLFGLVLAARLAGGGATAAAAARTPRCRRRSRPARERGVEGGDEGVGALEALPGVFSSARITTASSAGETCGLIELGPLRRLRDLLHRDRDRRFGLERDPPGSAS